MHRLLENGIVTLHGIVGIDFTAADVNAALAEAGPDTPLEIRLSSFGGDAGEGLAIYSALIAHRRAHHDGFCRGSWRPPDR